MEKENRIPKEETCRKSLKKKGWKRKQTDRRMRETDWKKIRLAEG
jgi:hypothetical protein